MDAAQVQSVFTMHFIEYYVTLCYYAFWLQDLNRLAAYMGVLMTLKQVRSNAKGGVLYRWSEWLKGATYMGVLMILK
eukprot:7381078-Pyramimonas_sp.AAC.1